jgi:hypothetical protein
MRVYLKSQDLGKAISHKLKQKNQTQIEAAIELDVQQGQISHILSGHFQTNNELVRRLCKYVKLDPESFRRNPKTRKRVAREAVAALTRACEGEKHKTAVIVRVLRALEKLQCVK